MRRNELLHGAFTLLLTLCTLILAVVYAAQLWIAPIHGGMGKLVPPKGSLIATYGVPTLVGIVACLASLIHIYRDPAKPNIGARGLVVSSVIAAMWLTTVVIWGHCHCDTGEENPWYDVCYQLNLERDVRDDQPMIGVNKALGNATIALAALVLMSHLVDIILRSLALWKSRRAASSTPK